MTTRAMRDDLPTAAPGLQERAMREALQTEPPSAGLTLPPVAAPIEGDADEPPSVAEEPPSSAGPVNERTGVNEDAGATVQALHTSSLPTPHRKRNDQPDSLVPRRRKARRLALVCNVKPSAFAARVQDVQHGPDDEFEEFDSPATIHALAQLLTTEGYAVSILEADRTLPRRLTIGNFDLVFNIAEGKGGRCREALVPALCEMLGIAYTGSDPLTLAATLDKAVAKRLVVGDVATPRWRTVRRMSDLDGFDLQFPVFAKPNDEGSSKGIRNDSRCEDLGALQGVCARLLDTYGRPVLVEEFVRGHEVTVGVVGNQDPEVVGIMHVVPTQLKSAEDFVYSLEVKRDWEHQVRYAIPPELPDDVCRRIEAAALKCFRLLDCRDVARIDFRVGPDGEPWFIEANPLPGLSPTSGDLVLTAKAMGWTWERLITRIVREAEFRQGVLQPKLVPRLDRRKVARPLPLLERMLDDTSSASR
jgi:D-alanine-D-alanine ligase